MSTRLKKQLVNYLFKLMIIDNWGIDFYSFVKSDFLDISLNAMYTLKCASKFNLLHSMSKCFFKSNQYSKPRMPLNKMPFGLIDYNIRFFASNSIQSVHAEKHYTSWTETMFAHFGHKWLSLFRGPAWQYETQAAPTDVVKKSVISTTPITQSEISSSTNLIECAMLESGIQDVPYDSFIQSTSEIQSLLLDQSGSQLLDSEYDSCIQLEERGVNHKDDFNQLEPRKNLSHLWTHLASNDVMEIIDGNVSPRLMEQHHHITPNVCPPAKRITSYDPIKVC